MAPTMRVFSKLRSVDFYKKIPSDLTEATLTGAWLSLAASVIMATLLVLVRLCARLMCDVLMCNVLCMRDTGGRAEVVAVHT
jgi:hypothetical protein